MRDRNIKVDKLKRKWLALDRDDEKMLQQLFNLSESKLTASQLFSLTDDNFNEIISQLRSQLISIKDLQDLSEQDFYLLISQAEDADEEDTD